MKEEHDMQKYYIMPKDALGQRMVIDGRQGRPINIDGVQEIELPNGDYLTVISKGKKYPAHKIALAVALGQIKKDDVRGQERR